MSRLCIIFVTVNILYKPMDGIAFSDVKSEKDIISYPIVLLNFLAHLNLAHRFAHASLGE